MCVTSDESVLSNTTIAWWEQNYMDVLMQNLLYQNAPVSRRGACAMLLHIPHSGMLQPGINLIDTSKCKRVLTNMRTACEPVRSKAPLDEYRSFSLSLNYEINDVGMYTMVSARSSLDLLSALKDPRIPADRRVTIRPELCAYYASHFDPTLWTVLLCLFNNQTPEVMADPIWVRYLSSLEVGADVFMPTIDAHTGYEPVQEMTHRDTFLIWGNDVGIGNRVYYSHSHDIEIVPEGLPSHVVGKRLPDVTRNGDCWMPRKSLAVGRLSNLDIRMPQSLS